MTLPLNCGSEPLSGRTQFTCPESVKSGPLGGDRFSRIGDSSIAGVDTPARTLLPEAWPGMRVTWIACAGLPVLDCLAGLRVLDCP